MKDIFECDPITFLDGHERLEEWLRQTASIDKDDENEHVLRHWKECMGAPCPTDLSNLMRAFANTKAVNTALYMQGRPLVVCPAGFGNMLVVPHGQNPAQHKPEWEGSFARGIHLDPGRDHATFLRDLIRNRVVVGGDPFYHLDLGSGEVYPTSANSLSALVYACALRDAKEHISEDTYTACVERVLPHLAKDREPAETLLETLPKHVCFDHSNAWSSPPSLEAFRLVEQIEEQTQEPTREWLVTAVRLLQKQELSGQPTQGDVLVLLREMIHLAEAPNHGTSTSDVLYAGLHTFLFAPKQIDDWVTQASNHMSPLVKDAAKTLHEGTHSTLSKLKQLTQEAKDCTLTPNLRAERCRLHPFEAQFFYMHGRW